MLVWRIVFGLIVICLVAGEIGDFSDEDYGESTIEKRSVLAAISAAFDIPGKVIGIINGVVDLRKKVKEANWATINLKFTNYCNWTLTDFEFNSFDGNIDVGGIEIENINPGQRFRLGGYQTEGWGKTEAIAYFDVKDWQCFFYWRVSDRLSKQSGTTELAVGCLPQNASQSMRSDIENYLHAEKKENTELPLKYRRYDKETNITRFCGLKNSDIPFCIEGIMKNDAHSVARIAVYPKMLSDTTLKTPKMLSDIANTLRNYTSQEVLDRGVVKEFGSTPTTTKSTTSTSEGSRLSQPFACLFGFVALLATLFAT